MKRVVLRSKELNALLAGYNFAVSKKDVVELLDDRVILINTVPSFFYYEGKLVPSLRLLQGKELLKKIVVDVGAVKFIIGGADVMRPGIVEIDPEIRKGDFVCIFEVKYRKPIAVGIALFSSVDMQVLQVGRVVTNIHYLGDVIWKNV